MGQVFSPEVPDLFPSHLEHLLASGISIDVIRGRGYKSLLGKSELEYLGFSKPQRRTPGLLIPLRAPDGAPAGCQYRPDNPRLNDKQKTVKYEGIPNSSLRLDMPLSCQAHARDPHVELWITEGAKKADALASRGVCAVNLSGVWGFKGKNEFGSSVFLADFDLIAWHGRNVFIGFDSDIMTKPMVKMALDRLKAHLERLGAKVFIIQLPDGPDGAKTGVDDYLAAGHSVEDLRELVAASPEVEEEPMALHNTVYCVHEGTPCVIKHIGGVGKVKSPLANFMAEIVSETIMDDGTNEARYFTVTGALSDGKALRTIVIPATSFQSFNFVPELWGSKAIIYAGNATKDHLRTMMLMASRSNGNLRRVFTHTGWRKVDGELCFLTNGGAIGNEGVEVELKGQLALYHLPTKYELDHGPNVQDAVRASLKFLEIGDFDVLAPLWALMYLAPLCEILNPAFTLWMSGHTGSYKSAVSALSLCHFGTFDYLSTPADWRDTANSLEYQMSVMKDIPLLIDDWKPAQTIAGMREMEQKAATIIRGQGNRSGRGRLKADATLREKYIPRGVVVSTGEQLPFGESEAARLFVVDMDKGQINYDLMLGACKDEAHLYKYAMGHYILWLRDNWEDLSGRLHGMWLDWQRAASQQAIHARLPSAVAHLYAGIELGLSFALENDVITGKEAREISENAWGCFITLASRQGARVDDERPALRFLEACKTLLAQQRVLTISRHCVEPLPGELKQGQTFVGWSDDEGYYFMPQAIYSAVFEFCQRSGTPITFKAPVVWADLARLDLLTKSGDDRNQVLIWVGSGRDDGVTRRVVAIKRSAVGEKEE